MERLDKIGLRMTTLERKRVRVAHIVEKTVVARLRWFRYMDQRLVDYVVTRVCHMEGN